MITLRRYHFVQGSLVVLAVAILFVSEQVYLDGTVINPVVDYRAAALDDHKMPLVNEATFDTTGTFTPASVVLDGAYIVQTDKTVYHIGDPIYAFVSFCKYKEIAPRVRWQLSNGSIIDLGVRDGVAVKPGCYTNSVITITKSISNDFKPGTGYTAYGTIANVVNPLRTITNYVVTNQFDIVR